LLVELPQRTLQLAETFGVRPLGFRQSADSLLEALQPRDDLLDDLCDLAVLVADYLRNLALKLLVLRTADLQHVLLYRPLQVLNICAEQLQPMLLPVDAFVEVADQSTASHTAYVLVMSFFLRSY